MIQNLSSYNIKVNFKYQQWQYYYIILKVTTYINSMLANVSEKSTPYKNNYYALALEKEFFIKKKGSNEPSLYI